jgi:hypothetical protein
VPPEQRFLSLRKCDASLLRDSPVEAEREAPLAAVAGGGGEGRREGPSGSSENCDFFKNKILLMMLFLVGCRQWTLTLMMPPCSPIGVFAGFAEVMEARLCWMLTNAEKNSLIGQRPATGWAHL